MKVWITRTSNPRWSEVRDIETLDALLDIEKEFGHSLLVGQIEYENNEQRRRLEYVVAPEDAVLGIEIYDDWRE